MKLHLWTKTIFFLLWLNFFNDLWFLSSPLSYQRDQLTGMINKLALQDIYLIVIVYFYYNTKWTSVAITHSDEEMNE